MSQEKISPNIRVANMFIDQMKTLSVEDKQLLKALVIVTIEKEKATFLAVNRNHKN